MTDQANPTESVDKHLNEENPENKKYNLPSPLVDNKEQKLFEELAKRYEKLIEPSGIKRFGQTVSKTLPDRVKELAENAKDALLEKQLYKSALEVIGTGFKAIQEQSVKYTISVSSTVKRVNQLTDENEIGKPEEFCLVRAYDLSSSVDKEKGKNLFAAFTEGAATGAPGFAGIPFNLVLSTFLYFRAVQAIALSYGYDVKNNPAELEIAGQVFSCALGSNDIKGNDTVSAEMGAIVAKIMMVSEMATVKQAAAKGWANMAAHGGMGLLLTQLRALACKTARTTLEKAGQKGLENTIFRSVFEQIGRRLALNTIQKAIPFVSAAIGAVFDTGMMKKVVDYADIFYCKRFIFEKEANISALIGDESIIEVYEVEQIASGSDTDD